MIRFRSFVSKPRAFFPSVRSAVIAGVTVAGLLVLSASVRAQDATQTTPAPAAATAQAAQTPLAPVSAPAMQVPQTKAEKKKAKADKKANSLDKKEGRLSRSKDTVAELKREKKTNPLAGKDALLPDKQLYDKALDATKHGRFDVARLDLQTLLNTYPESQYQMRAKLAVADSWYKEGGTAALTQAEQEYKDFITFFPNVPEAAEAQMRVGDIYFRQMDKPDRDYSKAVHAEQEYRTMLTQFPDSTLVPDAKQRLREVQEVLATREASIADFYATHTNWPASIARYQTVADTYPQYSHMDEVLIGLGDGYEAEGKYVRHLRLPEAAKARLERIYDEDAVAAYSKVVTEHSASKNVDEARDRLVAMNVAIPVPTAEQRAASEQLENSRAQYRLSDRATLLIMHKPDVVTAAKVGEPTLVDPKVTVAPDITKKIMGDFNVAMGRKPAAVPPPANAEAPVTDNAETAPPAPASTAPLALSDVPTAETGVGGSSAVVSVAPSSGGAGASSGNSVGMEIISPHSAPAADTGGLKSVGPDNATPLPTAVRPEAAPDTVNEIAPGQAPPAQAAPANGKKAPKPEFDKKDESSSKHKKKKGLNKLNPL
jgi:outer membrane protein assembly factor BamD